MGTFSESMLARTIVSWGLYSGSPSFGKLLLGFEIGGLGLGVGWGVGFGV